jgi:hypothetical protein
MESRYPTGTLPEPPLSEMCFHTVHPVLKKPLGASLHKTFYSRSKLVVLVQAIKKGLTITKTLAYCIKDFIMAKMLMIQAPG